MVEDRFEAAGASVVFHAVCEFVRLEGEQAFTQAFGIEADLDDGMLGPFAETVVATYALYRYLELLPEWFAKMGEALPAETMDLLAGAHDLTAEFVMARLREWGALGDGRKASLDIDDAMHAARCVIAYRLLRRVGASLPTMTDYAA